MRAKHLEFDEEDRIFRFSVNEQVGFALTNRTDEDLLWQLAFDDPEMVEITDQFENSGSGLGSSGEIVFICVGRKVGQTTVRAFLWPEQGFALDEREMKIEIREF